MGLFYVKTANTGLEISKDRFGAIFGNSEVASNASAEVKGDILGQAVGNSKGQTSTTAQAKSQGKSGEAVLSVWRLGLAVAFLVILIIFGLYSSSKGIEPWDSVLPSSFQLLVGAVIGALIGEKIGNSDK